MPRFRVVPYKQGSKSAKALAQAMKGKVLKLEGSAFNPVTSDVIVGWGQTDMEKLPKGGYRLLNPPVVIKNASNKLKFFQLMAEAGHESIIPRFWTNAASIPDDAFPIVCRTELAGHSGAGIVLADTRAALVPAPLYVEYVKKMEEYRIHVGRKGGENVVISVQRKARRSDVPDHLVNWKVRNLAGGFVYVRGGVSPPTAVLNAARDALGASGLDFGAVDVIYNQEKKAAYVLEVNTAPGLEGQTVEDYASFFSSY